MNENSFVIKSYTKKRSNLKIKTFVLSMSRKNYINERLVYNTAGQGRGTAQAGVKMSWSFNEKLKGWA